MLIIIDELAKESLVFEVIYMCILVNCSTVLFVVYCIVVRNTLQWSILPIFKSSCTYRRLQRSLHYYDGLANQDEAIRLTIDTLRYVPTSVIDTLTDNAEGRGSLVEDALTPPLELCI